MFKRITALDNFNTPGQIGRRFNFNRQTETVKQLGAQFALFRVAAAHQDKAGRMTNTQALALDHVLARGSHVDQQVHQVVFQQVDFIDVQKSSIGPRQQARLKGFDPLGQSALQVKRADHAIFSCTQG